MGVTPIHLSELMIWNGRDGKLNMEQKLDKSVTNFTHAILEMMIRAVAQILAIVSIIVPTTFSGIQRHRLKSTYIMNINI